MTRPEEAMSDNPTLTVGDKLVSISSSHFLGRSIGQTATVERLTPTGIAVLSNGERLNPAKCARYGEMFWEVRGGGDAWNRHRYYRADGEEAAEARRQERDQADKHRIDVAYNASCKAGHTDKSLAVLAAAIEVRVRRLAEETA